jgi:hypothetical protein
MSHKFLNLAYQAASFPECCILVDDALDCLSKRLQEKMYISASPSILCDSYSAQPQIPRDEDILSTARLKKKVVQQKTSKRHRSWLDKSWKYTNKSSVCCCKSLQYIICIHYYFLNDKSECFHAARRKGCYGKSSANAGS